MSGYTFPDTPAALLEVIGDTATLWLQSYEGTVNHVYSAGGAETGPLRFDRIVVNTYAPGRDAAREESERVRELLTAAPHDTAEGLIDSVDVEVTPHDILFQHDTQNQYQAIYRVHTRPL